MKQLFPIRNCIAAALAGVTVLLAAESPASSAYDVPNVECSKDEVAKAKAPFKDFIEAKPTDNCKKNPGTVYDSSAALEVPDAQDTSLCRSAYSFMISAVNKYAKKIGDNCNAVKKEAEACKAKSDQQKIMSCMGTALVNQSNREKEAISLLKTAQKKAKKYISLTSDTKRQYAYDAKTIESAMNQRMTQAIKAREAPSVTSPIPPDPSQATSVNQGQLSKDGYGEVVAQYGGASTISGYQQAIPQLQDEQEKATQKLQSFEQAATKEADNRALFADRLAKEGNTTLLKSQLMGTDCRITNSCTNAKESTISGAATPKPDPNGSGASTAGGSNAGNNNTGSGLSQSSSGQSAPSTSSSGSGSAISAPPMMSSSGASSGGGSSGGDYSSAGSYTPTLQTGTSPTPGNSTANGGGAGTGSAGSGAVNTQTGPQPENTAGNIAGKKDDSVKIGTGDAFVSGAGDLPAVSSASRAPAKGAQAASATAKGGAAASVGGSAAGPAAHCAPGDQACAALQEVKGGQFNNIGSLGTNIASGGGAEDSSLPSLDSLFGNSGSESGKMADSAAMKSVMNPFGSAEEADGQFTNGAQASAGDTSAAIDVNIFERVRLVHLRAQKRGSILQIPRKL